MKNLTLFLALIAAFLLVSPVAYSQDGPPPDEMTDLDRPDQRRPNLLAELGLTPEQIQQVRRLNQERRPALMAAQTRMREANRNLDMAIYSDTVSDKEFQTRLQEFQAAQAELARLRFDGELAVRKILTPEQLVRFRELRRRFAEMRNNRQDRRFPRDRQDRPAGPPPGRDLPPRRPIN